VTISRRDTLKNMVGALLAPRPLANLATQTVSAATGAAVNTASASTAAAVLPGAAKMISGLVQARTDWAEGLHELSRFLDGTPANTEGFIPALLNHYHSVVQAGELYHNTLKDLVESNDGDRRRMCDTMSELMELRSHYGTVSHIFLSNNIPPAIHKNFEALKAGIKNEIDRRESELGINDENRDSHNVLFHGLINVVPHGSRGTAYFPPQHLLKHDIINTLARNRWNESSSEQALYNREAINQLYDALIEKLGMQDPDSFSYSKDAENRKNKIPHFLSEVASPKQVNRYRRRNGIPDAPEEISHHSESGGQKSAAEPSRPEKSHENSMPQPKDWLEDTGYWQDRHLKRHPKGLAK
jgi:hypothetical protein